MLRDETLARLRRLNARLRKQEATQSRSSLPPSPVVRSEAEPAILRQRLAARPAAKNFRTEPSGISTGREVETSNGKYWLVRRPLPRLWSAAQIYLRTWEGSRQLDEPSASDPGKYADRIRLIQQHPDYLAFLHHFPDRCVFLDLETCGFAGSTIFLAGVIHTIDGELCLSQFWARNYSEERSLLCALQECLKNQQVLITFNGKSFDWPQVRDRCVLYARSADAGLPDLTHLDLLHFSRRRWKGQLTNCKLQTLERHICGRTRTDDVPGREIPEVYHHYVRSGDTSRVDGVLHHNALDLITLLQLALIVGQPKDDREQRNAS